WLEALHFQQLRRFGGLYGVRDEGAVEAALARAIHKWSYDRAEDHADLAAAYGFGLARSHGYSDGNKRIAFMAMAVFLEMNGWTLEVAEEDVVDTMLRLAAGDLEESALADWLRDHIRLVVE